MKKLLIKAVALGAAIAATSAGGFALGSSTSPVIHACYQAKAPHTLVKDTACPRGYHALSWNVTGPQGKTGKPGPAGGANVFVALNSASFALSTTDVIAVDTLSLSAGKYLLSATTDVSGLAGGQTACDLLDSSGIIDSASVSIAGYTTSGSGTATLALAGAVTITSATKVELACAGGLPPASPASVSHDVITATELTSLTTSGS